MLTLIQILVIFLQASLAVITNPCCQIGVNLSQYLLVIQVSLYSKTLQTSFLVWTFFAVSLGKVALMSLQTQQILIVRG